jgi:hypothetical protein
LRSRSASRDPTSRANALGGRCLRQHERRARSEPDPRDPLFANLKTAAAAARLCIARFCPPSRAPCLRRRGSQGAPDPASVALLQTALRDQWASREPATQPRHCPWRWCRRCYCADDRTKKRNLYSSVSTAHAVRTTGPPRPSPPGGECTEMAIRGAVSTPVRNSTSRWPLSVALRFQRPRGEGLRSTCVPSVKEIVPPGSQRRPENDPTCWPSTDSMRSSQPRRRAFIKSKRPSAQIMRTMPRSPGTTSIPTLSSRLTSSKCPERFGPFGTSFRPSPCASAIVVVTSAISLGRVRGASEGLRDEGRSPDHQGDAQTRGLQLVGCERSASTSCRPTTAQPPPHTGPRTSDRGQPTYAPYRPVRGCHLDAQQTRSVSSST